MMLNSLASNTTIIIYIILIIGIAYAFAEPANPLTRLQQAGGLPYNPLEAPPILPEFDPIMNEILPCMLLDSIL